MKNIRVYLIIVAIISSLNAKSQIQVDTTGNVTIGDTTQILKINGSIQGNINGGALQINTGNRDSIWLQQYHAWWVGPYVYLQIGPQNTNFCHFITNCPSFYFNAPIMLGGSDNIGTIGSSGDLVFETSMNYLSGYPAMTIYNSNGFIGIGTGSEAKYLLDLGTSPNSQIRAYVISPSDSVLKTNIKKLTGASTSLKLLQGVTYKLKPNSTTSKLSKATTKSSMVSDSSRLKNYIDTTDQYRTHIGFLAQDVQKIFPELVYTDKNGILGLDYTGLIPVLVESIKELSTKISSDSSIVSKLNQQINSDSITIAQMNANLNTISSKLQSLTTQINQCCGISKQINSTTNTSVESDQVPSATQENGQITNISNLQTNNVTALYQNSPNPFNLSTTIGYTLASNAGSATIYVYNMQGAQLKSFPIYTTGNGSITINGSDLSAGMYLYALIVDGNLIDTKKMILTN